MFMPSDEAIAQTMRERGVDAAELARHTGIVQERVEELCGQRDLPSIPTVGEARAIAQALGDGISCRATNDWWARNLVAWLEEAQAAMGPDEYCFLAHFPSGDCRVAFYAVDEWGENADWVFEAFVCLDVVFEYMSIADALEIAREQLNPVFEFPEGGRFVTPDVQTWEDLAKRALGIKEEPWPLS